MTTETQSLTLTVEEWRAEAIAKFGPDEMQWKWVCPSCGHVCTTQDYKDAGAKSGAVGYSCIGRFIQHGSREKVHEAFGKKDGGPCNYAGGGLIGINPVTVIDEQGGKHHMFAFADN
jgi:hypothetical protein